MVTRKYQFLNMASQDLPSASAYKSLVLSKESVIRCQTPDDEPLVRQPPKPIELNSLNAVPDPDLQLTPLKQNEQPKSLLRSQTGNSKVRHRVRFQESQSFSSDSEQDISNKISEVTISDDLDHFELEQKNQNNNNLRLGHDSFSDIAPSGPPNFMFFDVDSGVFTPQHTAFEVVREINPKQTPSPTPLTFDFPSDFEIKRNNSANSRPYCEKNYQSKVPMPDITTSATAERDFESLPKEENDAMQTNIKSISSKPDHFQVAAVSTDLYPGNAQTLSLPYDASSIDKEPSLFAQPKLHSTLIIAEKIKALQKKRPDLTRELKKSLVKKEQRDKINEKAASKVDIRSNKDLYPGLISLDVSNLQLAEAATMQRTTKIKHTKKKQTTSGLEPDLLEFFTEDQQKETADFSLPGIPNPAIETCKAPSLIAFDLYRHNRMWEGQASTI